MQSIVEVLETLTQALADFDPARLSGSEAVALVEVLARGEKVCAAARARATARVEDSHAYRARGHRSGGSGWPRPWAPAQERPPPQSKPADALMKLLSGQGTGSSSRAEVVVIIDLARPRRDHTHDGERCHIPGIGPLPIDVARRVASDAFLKGVLVDGCEIKK